MSVCHLKTALRAPPSIISVTVQPTYYQYGDDVVLTCIVTSYPAPDYIGWNMKVAIFFIS